MVQKKWKIIIDFCSKSLRFGVVCHASINFTGIIYSSFPIFLIRNLERGWSRLQSRAMVESGTDSGLQTLRLTFRLITKAT